MKHVIDARYGARANGHIEKAARDELDAIQQMCDVFATARREVVDYNDVLALLDELFREVGSDEPGAARDQISHFRPKQ